MTDLSLLYAQHLARDRRRSAHTVRAYQATAERLLAFLQAHWGGPVDDLGKVTAADLRAFLAARRGAGAEGGLGNASAARELSAVRGFLAFAGADAPKLRGPRVKRGVPRPVSPADAVALAEEVAEDAREPWIGARDWAVLLLLYGAGLRIGEAMGLPARVLPLGEVLSVTGKRGKTRMVPLLPQVRAAVEAYAQATPWPVAGDAPLFRGAKGGPLSAAVVRRSVRAARTRLGWTGGRRRMRCGTRSQRTCWAAARTCARCRNCWAMPACRRRKSILRSMPRTLLDVYRHAHPRQRQ